MFVFKKNTYFCKLKTVLYLNMRKLKLLIVSCFVLLLVGNVYATANKSRISNVNKLVVKVYTDSLNRLIQDYPMRVLRTPVYQNPYYYPLLGAPTFYFTPVRSFLETDSTKQMSKDSLRNYLINRALFTAYMTNPEYFSETEGNIMQQVVPDERKVVNKDTTGIMNIFQKKHHIVPETEGLFNNEQVIVKRPDFWKKTGNATLQFSQNYISDNWSGGGSSNNVLQGGIVLQATYDNKRGFQFDNKLEMTLGFIATRDDTIHQYKTSTDLIRLTSNVGLQAFKNWYYSLGFVCTTQFMPGYKNNDPTTYSAFLSPLVGDLNLGMTYKLKKDKKLDISLMLAPAAYEFKYVARRSVDGTQFGLDPGDITLHKIGSSVTLNSVWNILKMLKWTSRLYYFTSYENVLWEWENTFDFILTKYISARFYLFNRFDDSRQRTKPDESFFQLKELLSIGLNYSF